ncbi:hypothetical protein Nmel_010485 [Mimus melanotis]
MEVPGLPGLPGQNQKFLQELSPAAKRDID